MEGFGSFLRISQYLKGALGGSGGPGGNPGRLAVGRRPLWNPLFDGLFNGKSFPLIGRCGGGRGRNPEGGFLSGR